jgi:ArsR family transcriptional regulator, arsenate/arsenite/antimonite-responsive transcriptional repressor
MPFFNRGFLAVLLLLKLLDEQSSVRYTCIMVQVRKSVPKTPKQAACCSSELDELLDPNVFKALGDPTRLKLLSCLARCGRECTTSEVGECCSVDFSVVTRHLTLLADAGIIESRKEARTVYYKVRYSELAGSLRSLANAFEECCSPKTRKGKACGCA